MKVLKIFAVSILAMLVMCACDRSEPDQIEMDYFYGAWQEYFGPDYHVEGSRTWYIKEGSITVNTYDWYSDTESERFLTYSLEQEKGKYRVTLHFQDDPEMKDQSYYIIKLTDEEMIWQIVGSESDTRHFVNGKYWASHQE